MSSSRKNEKRSRSSSNDVNNQSFVSNVTSRMTGLLPASLASWFSSPSSASANGSAQLVDDDSSGDEAPQSPPSPQPPTKRMRLSPPAEFNHYDTSHAKCVSIETTETRTTHTTVQPLGRSTYRWGTSYSTSLRSPEAGDRSDQDSTTLQTPTSRLAVSSGPSAAVKRKSLFDVPTNNETKKPCEKTARDSMRDPSQPCFKPSLLGSPFYPGRTTYGGAASSYVYQPNIRQRKDRVVTAVNSSTADNSVSHSARRIMDLLENYSSPLNDSRRIPHYPRSSIAHLDTASTNTNTSSTNSTAYKTQELHVPSIASILRLKQRSRLMDSTTAARQLIASHSSTSDYMPYYSQPPQRGDPDPDKEMDNKMTTKIKSNLCRRNMPMELPAAVNLPTAVLQIDQFKLPKFSIDAAAPAPAKRPSVTATVTRPVEPAPGTSSFAPVNSFKFASPVMICAQDSAQSAVTPGFTFGSPDRTIDRPKDNKNNDMHSFSMSSSKPLVDKENTNKSKDWKCADCWVSNKSESDTCVCCGANKLAANGVQNDTVKMNSITKIALKKADDAWKCGDCWVSNDAKSATCTCCGGARPSGAPAGGASMEQQWKCKDCRLQNKGDANQCAGCFTTRPPSSVDKAADAVKVSLKTHTDKWECTSCLVRNDSDKTKCVCCETDKPGLANTPAFKTTFNFSTSANTTFKFGIPSSNTTSTPQPIDIKSTVESKPENEVSETNNNVLQKIPTITFGLPSKQLVDQTTDSKKQSSVTSETTKSNFSFGIPKTVESTAASTMVTPVVAFSIPSKEDSTPKTKEALEKSQINLIMNKPPESPKSFANFFSPPVSQSIQEKPLHVSAPLSTPAATETSVISTMKSTTPMFSFTAPSATPAFTASATPAFTASATPAFTASVTPTFSASATPAFTASATPAFTASATPAFTASATPAFTASATPAFTASATPAFTASATPAFTASATPAFAAPIATSTATASPFLQKPESTSSASLFTSTNATSTSLMFQKSDGSAALAPIFSFGSNTPSTAVNTEPPKFNFSFGSNSKTDNALFKPTNATTDNSSTNKFSVPNAFGSGSGLTNALSGVNGLPSGMSVPTTTATSALPSGGGLFGAAPPKDSLWSAPSSAPASVFATTTPSATPQKPVAFTFGTSTPFNATGAPAFGASSQATPAFGAATQSTTPFAAATQVTPGFGAVTQPAPTFGAQTTFGAAATTGFGASSTPAFGTGSPAFGTSSQPAAFGAAPQPTANLFGTSQTSPFGSSAGGGANPGLFGSTLNAPSSGGLFGSPAAAPTFGAPNPSQPPFEAPSATPAPAVSTFNFTPQSSGVFGFGQQQQPVGGGVYAFGAGGGAGAGPVQFNMGSGSAAQPSPARRVIRKAVRRTNVRQ